MKSDRRNDTTDDAESTNPAKKSGMNHKGRKPSTWRPVYELDKKGKKILLGLPIDWICPCGTLLGGSKSCPKCGHVPLDQPPRPRHTNIRMKKWRKFGKKC
jgi:hypothetical protein